MKNQIITKRINGLNVILCPFLNVNNVYMDLAFHAGTIYENNLNKGISHFAEHLMSKILIKSASEHPWISTYWDDTFMAYTNINRTNFELEKKD